MVFKWEKTNKGVIKMEASEYLQNILANYKSIEKSTIEIKKFKNIS